MEWNANDLESTWHLSLSRKQTGIGKVDYGISLSRI
jgi:hypothetical protein